MCHCEIQNAVDESFAERMLIYFCRIFNRYQKTIASFAVLAEAKHIEEKEKVRVNLISTQERHGFAKGLSQGMQQGETTLLTKQLKAKFSILPNAYVEKIQQADPNLLIMWGINFVTTNFLEEIFE